jgi:hypothetical protein
MVGTQVTGKRLWHRWLRPWPHHGATGEGFDMTIHYHDLPPASPDQDKARLSTRLPEDLMTHCDFLAIPLRVDAADPANVNAERIALLPKGAIVVNASRERIVDDDAPIAAEVRQRLLPPDLTCTTTSPTFIRVTGICRTLS